MRPRFYPLILLPFVISCAPKPPATAPPAMAPPAMAPPAMAPPAMAPPAVPKTPIASRDPKVQAIVKQIAALPPWAGLTQDDKAAVDDLLEKLRQFEKVDEPVLRNAVELFLEDLQDPTDTNEVSKIFVLNRYYFKVPATEVRALGGWFAVNMCWPLEFDSAGKPSLTGSFRGYSGPPYDAIKEFHYLKDKFGRRPFASTNVQEPTTDDKETPHTP